MAVYACIFRASGAFAGLLLLAMLLPVRVQADAFIQIASQKSFDDVLADLEFAIGERNFRIVGRNDIGQGIRSRGQGDFPRSVVIQFCNLAYAQDALEIDPTLILRMPCRIAVYEHEGRVYVGTDLLPEDSANRRAADFARKINAILSDIALFAVK